MVRHGGSHHGSHAFRYRPAMDPWCWKRVWGSVEGYFCVPPHERQWLWWCSWRVLRLLIVPHSLPDFQSADRRDTRRPVGSTLLIRCSGYHFSGKNQSHWHSPGNSCSARPVPACMLQVPPTALSPPALILLLFLLDTPSRSPFSLSAFPCLCAIEPSLSTRARAPSGSVPALHRPPSRPARLRQRMRQ